MKLAAIYNVWDGVELLPGSINCLKEHVDVFIIVTQSVSNFGEQYEPMHEFRIPEGLKSCVIIQYAPENTGGSINEKKKRNIGLDYAKHLGCTHFLHVDCDEYYEDFGKAKQLFIDSGASGSVCKLMTYFKSPTLRFENPDNYYVPFIHRLHKETVAGTKGYPFYVDPTRSINETAVLELPVFMHHFSYIRKDIERKVRNSSARANIAKSQLLYDYHNPDLKPGYFVKDFNQTLVEVENQFNISL